MGSAAGRLAEHVLRDGHHLKLVDLLLDRAADWVLDNQETVARLVSDRSPTWVAAVRGLVGGRQGPLELYKFVLAVQADPDHPMRRQLDAYLNSLAQDLQHDPEMMARVEAIKHNALGDPEVRALATRTWETLKTSLLEAVGRSAERVEPGVQAGGGGLRPPVGHRRGTGGQDRRLDRGGGGVPGPDLPLADRQRHHRDGGAVGRARRPSRKIELQVGRDLQFIRINGTVVGSLAGLTIFTVATAVFG